jgi:hypothetical protein
MVARANEPQEDRPALVAARQELSEQLATSDAEFARDEERAAADYRKAEAKRNQAAALWRIARDRREANKARLEAQIAALERRLRDSAPGAVADAIHEVTKRWAFEQAPADAVTRPGFAQARLDALKLGLARLEQMRLEPSQNGETEREVRQILDSIPSFSTLGNGAEAK